MKTCEGIRSVWGVQSEQALRHSATISMLCLAVAIMLPAVYPGTARAISEEHSPVTTVAENLSAGALFSCVLRPDGHLDCWGDNTYGQRNPPIGLFRALSTGRRHACAIAADGEVACWGADGSGQASPPTGSFKAISAGYSHTCGIKTNNTAVCWGLNNYGQTAAPSDTLVQISAGGYHTCGITTQGVTLCWGKSADGQINVPDKTFRRVTAGLNHTCALEYSGQPRCWGSNTYGQTTLPTGFPLYESLEAGNNHTCGVTVYGSVQCWGYNNKGQCDPPGTAKGTGYQITAGGAHTCLMTTEGKISCWGNNDQGQLDKPSGTYSPLRLSAGGQHTCGIHTGTQAACWGNSSAGPAPTQSFKQISAGTWHTCGIWGSGGILCWGATDHGVGNPPVIAPLQVGSGLSYSCVLDSLGEIQCWGDDNYDKTTPPQGVYTQISVAPGRACALTPDGNVTCWGFDFQGASEPFGNRYVQIATGSYHTCGIRRNGTVGCWGRNDNMQILPPSGVFVQLCAGSDFSCGLQADGTVACWGADDDARNKAPLGTFASVTCGLDHACVVRTDGSITCWGENAASNKAPRLTISPNALPMAFSDVDYSAALSTQGGIPPYMYTLVNGTLPPGIYLSIIGQMAGSSIHYGTRRDIIIQASDITPMFPRSQQKRYVFSLNATGNATPVFTTPPVTVMMSEDSDPVPFALSLSVNDPNSSDLILWRILTPPLNGTASVGYIGRTQQITYIPKANYNGADSFEVMAEDQRGGQATRSVDVSISPQDDAPTAADDYYEVLENTSLFVNIPGVMSNDFTVDGTGMSVVIATQPSHGSVSMGTDGFFEYTPTDNYFGEDSFTYTLRDGGAINDTATVHMTITPDNYPPIVYDDMYAGTEDTPLVRAAPGVLRNDSDPDSPSFTAVLFEDAGHGSVNLAPDGGFTYTPEPNFNGDDTFTYRAFDNDRYSEPATVTLRLSPVNDPPVAVGDLYVTQQNLAKVVAAPGVLTNDSDVEGQTLTAALYSNPSHGEVTLNANGSFIYTPFENFYGNDSFRYRAFDGNAYAEPATVTMRVTVVNRQPVVRADDYSIRQNMQLIIPAAGVLANDYDPDGDALTAHIATAAAHGQVALQPNGAFTYTPNTDFTGTDTFYYQAHDGYWLSETAAVTIEVINYTQPVARNNWYTATEDTLLRVGIPGILGNDVYEGSNPTIVVLQQPAHGVLTMGNGGAFTYMPDENFNGANADYFTYNINDGIQTSASAQVTFTIRAVNDLPVTGAKTFGLTEDTERIVNAPGLLVGTTDPDGPLMKAVKESDPEHGTLVLNDDGSFSYTPDENYNGIDEFLFKVFDGLGYSEPKEAYLSIQAVNDPPVALPDTFEITEDTLLTIAAPGLLENDSDVEESPLQAVKVTDPSFGVLTLAADGSFTYMPSEDFNGEDQFMYRAFDGNKHSTHTPVSITVTPQNDAPVANDDAYNVAEGVLLMVDAPGLLENDSDIDEDMLSVELVEDVQGGTLTLNDDGSFTYRTGGVVFMPDFFTYRVFDGAAWSAPATVTLNITEAEPGQVCQKAITIDVGVPTCGDTSTQFSAYEAEDCGGDSLAGPDIFYRVDLPEPGYYTITLTPADEADLALVELAGCDPTECKGMTNEFGDGRVEVYGPFPVNVMELLFAVDSVSDDKAGAFDVLVERLNVDCDDDDACTDDAFNGIECTHEYNTAACDDDNACTLADTCAQGQCIGAPVTCEALDECHVAGQCDTETGICDTPVADDGTPCDDDGDLCNGVSACQQGICTQSVEPVVCPAPDQCHVAGTCDAQTGLCSNPPADQGTVCDDDDACTYEDQCDDGGQCAGTMYTCDITTVCHEAPECDGNGACSETPLADGTDCSGDAGVPALCRSAACVVRPEGDLCDTALNMEEDTPLEIDLDAMWNDEAPETTCLDLGVSGPEAYLTVDVAAGHSYRITVAASGDGDADAALWLQNQCSDGCSLGSDLAGTQERLEWTAESDGSVIVVVDTAADAAGGTVEALLEDITAVADGDLDAEVLPEDEIDAVDTVEDGDTEEPEGDAEAIDGDEEAEAPEGDVEADDVAEAEIDGDEDAADIVDTIDTVDTVDAVDKTDAAEDESPDSVVVDGDADDVIDADAPDSDAVKKPSKDDGCLGGGVEWIMVLAGLVGLLRRKRRGL